MVEKSRIKCKKNEKSDEESLVRRGRFCGFHARLFRFSAPSSIFSGHYRHGSLNNLTIKMEVFGTEEKRQYEGISREESRVWARRKGQK